MRPRSDDMAPAAGILLGLVLSIGGVAIGAAVAAWGEPAVRYAAWVALTMVEVVR